MKDGAKIASSQWKTGRVGFRGTPAEIAADDACAAPISDWGSEHAAAARSKVIEIAQNLSCPYAAGIPAALGANVFNVERPRGAAARRMRGRDVIKPGR